MHVCLFDIDGTLLSSGGAGRAAFEAAIVDAFSLDRLIAGVLMSGRTDRAIARDLFDMHGVPHTRENWERFRAAYLRLLPGELVARGGRILPGVAELLALLVGRDDVAVGLLTGNLREGAQLKLGHHGLFDHFSFGAFGDEHFDRDGVAREALAAVRRHVREDVDADQIWVIGDTPLDIQCARAIGARSVAVTTGVHTRDDLAPERPDVLLDDLSQSSSLLAMWR